MKSLVPDSAKYDLNQQLQSCQSNCRRNGKVARLPLALRHEINRMLDDGVEYPPRTRRAACPRFP